VVRVHDHGPGPADPLTGLVPAPGGSAGAGFGLWLIHQFKHTAPLSVEPPPDRRPSRPFLSVVGRTSADCSRLHRVDERRAAVDTGCVVGSLGRHRPVDDVGPLLLGFGVVEGRRRSGTGWGR
jgi:hypothetical protein